MEARDIIIRPVLTEKSNDGIETKRYVFVVAKTATKTAVRMAVEELFGVKVAKVNTVNCHGKLKRMGRNEGYTSDYKKAIVQLTKDSKDIEFFKSLA